MTVFLTTVLVLLCLVIVLLIMFQRTSGGMGSALGGGTADQMLGAGSAAQLSKLTVYGILGFFVLSFVLYAFYQREADNPDNLLRKGGTPALEADPVSAADIEVPLPENVISPPAPAPVEEEIPVPTKPEESPKSESNATE